VPHAMAARGYVRNSYRNASITKWESWDIQPWHPPNRGMPSISAVPMVKVC